MSPVKSNRKWWLVIGIILFGGAWVALRKAGFDPFTGDTDSVFQEVTSPDRRYVARLLYKEHMMVYGYYHVTISPGSPEGVIEVAAEGLENLEWKDNSTLIVSYQASDHQAPIEFVKRPNQWHDVKIEYKPAIESEGK